MYRAEVLEAAARGRLLDGRAGVQFQRRHYHDEGAGSRSYDEAQIAHDWRTAWRIGCIEGEGAQHCIVLETLSTSSNNGPGNACM